MVAHQASLSFTISRSLLKLKSIESVMPYNHLSLCRPLLLPLIFPNIRIFSNESDLRIRLSKYWSFSFSISPFKKYSRLVSFRMDWFDLLAVQWILKSLFQHRNLKALILRHSAFFMVRLSHLYMTTGKTTDLTIWTFAGKVMSLLFNMLSMFVITFLPRSKCLLISRLQSLSAVIFVTYKLALTMSIANNWTTKAFAIWLYGDWTPCCYSYWPSTIPEGVEGGLRHFVLQGIWWDRSLDSWMFLGTDFMISMLASPHI